MARNRSRVAAAALAAGLLLAACGGSDEPEGSATPTAGGPTGKTDAVEVKNLAFTPAEISVAAGTAVTWTNGDDFAHTVTSGSPDGSSTGVFDSPLETPGATFTFPFKEPGTVEYYCKIHPQMTGSVVVT